MVIQTIINDYKVFIGTNDTENTQIILDAKKEQLSAVWFHLSKFPSPHLLLFGELQEIPKGILYECARIVVSRSKYKHMKGLYVDYLPLKCVKALPKAGQVLLLAKPQKIQVK